MAKIPNPKWAYPGSEVNAAPGGLLVPPPPVVVPRVVAAAAPPEEPETKSKGKTK